MKHFKLALLLSFILIFYVVSGIFLAEQSLHLPKRPISQAAIERARKLGARDVEINSFDGTRLRGWYFVSNQGTGKVAILLHGQGDNRTSPLGFVPFLLAHGYDVLTPDSREHGLSNGDIATYGLLESQDVHQWEKWVVAERHPSRIVGLGESMGGAILLQSLKGDSILSAAVAECSFASFREIAYDRLGQILSLGPLFAKTALRPTIEVGLLWAQMRYDQPLGKIAPKQSVENVRIPILLIHGDHDTNIPPEHSREIAAHNLNIAVWIVPGAGHTGAYKTAPAEFEQKVLSVFESGKDDSQKGAK